MCDLMTHVRGFGSKYGFGADLSLIGETLVKTNEI